MLELIKSVAFIVISSLIVAAFMGFSFLKFYEEFRKGVEQKNRIRIWSAFSGAAFVVILFITVVFLF
jgi:uncharacterized membrane protein YidH (DUF202 family)